MSKIPLMDEISVKSEIFILYLVVGNKFDAYGVLGHGPDRVSSNYGTNRGRNWWPVPVFDQDIIFCRVTVSTRVKFEHVKMHFHVIPKSLKNRWLVFHAFLWRNWGSSISKVLKSLSKFLNKTLSGSTVPVRYGVIIIFLYQNYKNLSNGKYRLKKFWNFLLVVTKLIS